jgi:hypothetical protein
MREQIDGEREEGSEEESEGGSKGGSEENNERNSKAESDTHYLVHIHQWLSQHPIAQTWITEAGNIFKNNNKDGFKTLPSGKNLDTYQDGNEALDHCQQIVKRYLLEIEKINRENTELEAIYRSDLCIFSSRFKQIYGVPHA